MASTGVGRWNAELWQRGSVTFRGSRLKWLGMMAGCVLLTAIAVAMLVKQFDHLTFIGIGTMCLMIAVFGVYSIPRFLHQLIRGLVVRVDLGGVTVNNERYPWDEITEITTWVNPGTRTSRVAAVVIYLTESASELHPGKNSFEQKILKKVGKNILNSDRTCLYLMALKHVDLEELSAWMSDLHADNLRR